MESNWSCDLIWCPSLLFFATSLDQNLFTTYICYMYGEFVFWWIYSWCVFAFTPFLLCAALRRWSRNTASQSSRLITRGWIVRIKAITFDKSTMGGSRAGGPPSHWGLLTLRSSCCAGYFYLWVSNCRKKKTKEDSQMNPMKVFVKKWRAERGRSLKGGRWTLSQRGRGGGGGLGEISCSVGFPLCFVCEVGGRQGDGERSAWVRIWGKLREMTVRKWRSGSEELDLTVEIRRQPCFVWKVSLCVCVDWFGGWTWLS